MQTQDIAITAVVFVLLALGVVLAGFALYDMIESARARRRDRKLAEHVRTIVDDLAASLPTHDAYNARLKQTLDAYDEAARQDPRVLSGEMTIDDIADLVVLSEDEARTLSERAHAILDETSPSSARPHGPHGAMCLCPPDGEPFDVEREGLTELSETLCETYGTDRERLTELMHAELSEALDAEAINVERDDLKELRHSWRTELSETLDEQHAERMHAKLSEALDDPRPDAS